MFVVGRGIVHIHHIGGVGLVGHCQNVVRGQHHTILVKIRHCKRFVDQGVVGHLFAVVEGASKAGPKVLAHTLNSHCIVSGGNCIGVVGSPSAEELAGTECAHARVIDNLPKHRVGRNVGGLHIEGGNLRGAILKRHLETVLVVAFPHDIHGEGVGGEGDGAVLGHHSGHELGALGALVIDVEELAVHKLGVGKRHQDGVAGVGLPLVSAIGDGDVVGGHGGLAVGGVGPHGHGLHGGRHGHIARHGQALGVVVAHGVMARRGAVIPVRARVHARV